MRARDPACGVTVEPLVDYPGLELDPGADLARLAKRLAGRDDHAKVSYGTERGPVPGAGRRSGRGDRPGAMARAHKADEYVTRDELENCAAFVRRLIDVSR